jgi:hypothetical protein
MHIPKYQWLMPQPNTSCGFCDEVAVTSEFQKHFQLIADKIDNANIYPDGDFSYNPFSEITSNDLSFELVLPMAVDKYFTLYLGTEIIIFKSGSTTAFTHVGNIWVSTLPNLLKPAKIVEFLNDNIDPLIGTTSSETSGVILIEDVPSGSYVDDTPFSTLTNVTTVTATVDGMYLYNGYYDATTDKIKYLYISDFYTPLLILQANLPIVNGTTYEVSYGYISQSAFEYRVAVSDYYNPSAEPLINSATERTISYLFTSPATTTATVGIRFTPTTPSTAELSIDNIFFKGLEYQTLENVEVIDCDGIETEIDFATTIYNQNILVELLESLPNIFQLKFTDSNDNVFYSRWYEIKESSDCNGLIKVNWTNNCLFKEVDYKNLPFDNELLLTGVKIKQPLELHDNVDTINSSGAKVSIYKNTQASYEVRFHPFLEDTQNTIERIFEHKTVLINDEEYNAIEVYQTTEIDLGIYTGRIDLLKKGTEIISSSCCC